LADIYETWQTIFTLLLKLSIFTGASILGMIKLRLKRFGKKFEASYRIVAMNNDTRRDGRPLEELGFYNPRTDEVKLNAEAITKRLQEGAQPTDTVRRILEKANLLEQKQKVRA